MKNVATKMTTPNMIFQKEETCEGCQNKVQIYQMQLVAGPDKGSWIGTKMGCDCENIRLAREAVNNHKKLKIRKLKDVCNRNSLISKDLEKANFDNYYPKNNEQSYAKKVSKRYVEVFNIDEPRNISFHGTFGLGKSHLAKSIADEVMEKDHTAIFISVPKLLRKIKSTYSTRAEVNENEIIEMLEDVDLLILDDLGAEKHSDWTSERIFDIIDSRQGKHTIYTTNYSPNDLVKKIGERNFSRVVNKDTTVLEIKGKNYRLEDFEEGAAE